MSQTQTPPRNGGGILRSSAVMAAGTVASRASGFVRGALLVAALGTQAHADAFNIANTIPNMLYILLAGGVFNAVLVPQLVRAMKNDTDRGEAYTNRIITLAGLFLAGVSALLVIGAPWLMRLFLDGAWFSPQFADQRQSAIVFAMYCLPQVFFYGMFVLIGQVLNARGSFGPMMWAPIANNVISVAVLVAYLAVFGHAVDCEHFQPGQSPHNFVLGGFGSGQELLLGVGSTLGIAAQLLVLLPYLRKAGFRYRPRFDFRGTGLGHTMRLGVWTVLFVIVNQIAYTVVVRLASSGTSDVDTLAGCVHQVSEGTGYTIYSQAFVLIMVPHGIATVSLATAVLPRLSAMVSEGNLPALAKMLGSTMRTAMALIVPFAMLLAVTAVDVAHVTFGYGAGRESYDLFAPTLILFGVGLVFFTGHYMVLRGFYALEQTKLVFFIQCAVSLTNIAVAWVLTRGIDPHDTSPMLVLAYDASYLVGLVISFQLLTRQVGRLGPAKGGMTRYAVRLLLACLPAAGLAWLARKGLLQLLAGATLVHAAMVFALTTIVFGLVYLAIARALHLAEVEEITRLLTSRLPGGRRRRS